MSNSSQSLSQTQQQQLRLSPQQVRFGRLLEMTAPEFDDEVRRMLEENPALEAAPSDEAPVAQTDDEGREFRESAEQLQRADYASDDDIPSYRTHISNRSADDDYFEPVAVDSGPQGVFALDAQLAELDITPLERETALYVIGNLDSNGYLTRSPESIADDMAITQGITVDSRFVYRVLDIVRSLDPAGIGARDLRDCLLLQLRRMPDILPVARARQILSNYYDLFSKKHFERLQNVLRLTPGQFDEVMRLIRSLNPKPGALLEGVGADDRLSHIVPDFDITTDPDGNVSVTMLGARPDLVVAPDFSAEAIGRYEREGRTDRRMADAATFMRERHDAANEFIDMAARRADTLERVIRAVITLQHDFFTTGDRSRLRPMVLRDIRELTGLDLSVISRATSGKYAMTPAGMVALKSLFSESVGDEGEVSAHFIEAAIRRLIGSEDKTKPLSDEAICARLKSEGLDVARRTVAKYRERMGFPVARLRRN